MPVQGVLRDVVSESGSSDDGFGETNDYEFEPDARAALAAANAQCRMILMEHHLACLGRAQPGSHVSPGTKGADSEQLSSLTPAGGPLVLGAPAGERLWGASSFAR